MCSAIQEPEGTSEQCYKGGRTTEKLKQKGVKQMSIETNARFSEPSNERELKRPDDLVLLLQNNFMLAS
ncbi:MAG: hypothetical protein SVO01_07190 [Thermotogota bacterium]|nr:hypothetical protein [Thermotogota bacterium]